MASPMKSRKPIPLETFDLPTGKVTVLPSSPFIKKVRGFVEEPITPPAFSMKNRVRKIMTINQDKPPEVKEKIKKRKPRFYEEDSSMIEEEKKKLLSRMPQAFDEELFHKPIGRRGGTEVRLARQDDYDLASTSTGKRSRQTPVIFNNNAAKFKNNQAGSNVTRVSSKEFLNREKRRVINSKF